MQETLTLDSHAKINLHLDVGKKRNDGYHDIISVFQQISLHDTITITVLERNTENDKQIVVNGNFTCSPEENLIFKAADAFIKNSGIRQKLVFDVNKVIPEGAGLGGGSGNAAAVLRGLDTIFKDISGKSALSETAEKIGSDVPFFLKGGTAFVTGRGEILDFLTVDGIEQIEVIIISPEFKVKTSEAYSWLDSDRKLSQMNNQKKIITKKKEILEILNKPPEEWVFYNSFEKTLKGRYTEYQKLKDLLLKNNAVFFSITGSGSAVYGLFNSHKHAVKAYGEIKTYYPDTWLGNLLAG